MQDILIKILILSYGATAIIDTVGYWPTIIDLWRHKKPSANTHTYIMWTITTGIGFLYSLVILPDLLFRIVSGMMFFSNALILALTIRLGRKK
jgi:hypothetical protein